jgi:hypothetical protein
MDVCVFKATEFDAPGARTHSNADLNTAGAMIADPQLATNIAVCWEKGCSKGKQSGVDRCGGPAVNNIHSHPFGGEDLLVSRYVSPVHFRGSRQFSVRKDCHVQFQHWLGHGGFCSFNSRVAEVNTLRLGCSRWIRQTSHRYQRTVAVRPFGER